MKLRLFSLCVLFLAAGTFFTSCTQTDQPGTTTTGYHDTFSDISGLQVGQQYQFSISGNSSSSTVITGVSSYSGTASSGTVRVFWNRAAGDTSKITANAVAGSTGGSGIIVWAPASSSGSFRLYETAAPSSVGPSGLILGTTASTSSISGGSAGSIDLVLATNSNATAVFPFLTVVSPDDSRSLMTGTVRSTDFADNAVIVQGGLPDDKYSSGLVIPATNAAGAYDIRSDVTDSSSTIIAVRTQDKNYARVEIVPQPKATILVNGTNVTGNFLWGNITSGGKPYRFVDVNVTYQPTANLAFASRPSTSIHYANQTRRSAGSMIVK